VQAPRLIRSGWWVAAAAVLLTAAVAAVLIRPVLYEHRSAAAPPQFDLDSALVPRELIVRGMAAGSVHTLDRPATMAPQEIDRYNEEERGKLLVPDDRVIGVTINGASRAYPLRLMRWHELVNDEVGGEPIAITYSPLCDSVAVYSRRRGSDEIELEVSGLLYNSNTVLYERRPSPAGSPLWTQLTGTAIAGPDAGGTPELAARPARLTTWARWRAEHPETDVLAPLPELKTIYKRDPYHSYFGSDLLRFPVAPLPPGNGRALKDRLVVVDVGGTSTAFALPDLAAAGGGPDGTLDVKANGTTLRISYRLVPGTAEVEVANGGGDLRAVRYGFWFAWYAIAGIAPAHVS
jgi:hypothetical protein